MNFLQKIGLALIVWGMIPGFVVIGIDVWLTSSGSVAHTTAAHSWLTAAFLVMALGAIALMAGDDR